MSIKELLIAFFLETSTSFWVQDVWSSLLYMPFMFALDFAGRHWNFILVTSPTHTFFSIWLANEKEILYYETSYFQISSPSVRIELRRLEFNLDHVFPVLREFPA